MYGGADYFAKSAEELLALVMLESAEGLANAREILAVDGVDGCFVGPADLNVSLGHSPDTVPVLHSDTEAAIASIAATARPAARSRASTASASRTRRSASRRAIAS